VKRHGPVVLLVVSCLLAAAAVFQSFRFSQSDLAHHTRVAQLEHDAGAIVALVHELRAAQMAYLAMGQDPEFWMRRVSDLSADLNRRLTSGAGAEGALPATASLAGAAVALQDLMSIDTRARSALQSEQRYLASDLVFGDALTPARLLVERVQAARLDERATRDALAGRDRMLQRALMPVSLVLVLIAAYVAGSSRGPRGARSEAEEVAHMIRALPPPVRAPGVAAVITPPVATPPARPAAAAQPVAAATPTVPLSEMADLCADLARVIDGRDLPPLLERAAQAIGASGLIVWVVDTAGSRLTPGLAHGYGEKVLGKLGALDVDADTVTSLAFRTMRAQSMNGRTGEAAAIAVPLVTTQGCTGVLAAELSGSRSTADALAGARIVAAQLAPMLTPVATVAPQAAQA
jgi:hypothetical protein